MSSFNNFLEVSSLIPSVIEVFELESLGYSESYCVRETLPEVLVMFMCGDL